MKKQEASILFIELSGFSTDTESNPADGLQLLLDQIYQLLDTTVRLHHGSINRFTGDALLAVFTGSKTSKATALNAIQTALEISEQLISMSQETRLEPPIRIKTGVATGTILVSEIGHNDNKQTTLLGDAVINAGRISQFAETGQLLTDERSAETAKTFFEFQKLEPLPIRGGAEVLPVFEVIAGKRKKLELKTTGDRRIASEMVGRGREMEQMEGLFKQLLAGKGCIVNVVGKAGIGKSRLIAEMKVQPVMEKVLMLEGRALSTGQNLSYHPVIHLIKSWAGITEDDPPAHASEKLFQGIQRNQPEQADEIYAFLATMMGLPLEGRHKERVQGIEGDALEKLILKNLRDLIIAATKDKPRIYLIEDMHWSDASSIKLFESLYKLSQHHPVMFVNVLRPGYPDTGDHILKYLVDQLPGDHITIHVSPLDTSDSGLLIQNLIHDSRLPETVKATIIRKTEGNPFFIEEVIRSFLDEGIIEVENNVFRITEKIHEVNIPETINEVILSRVDKLDEKTKELLKTASVIGRNFYFKVLEEAADTIGELDERLQYLKDVQLIGESKKKDDIEFLFKHALAQQATYESILQKTKKELHLKIARSIEKVFAEKIHEFYGTLAYHYEKAGNEQKTEEYLIKAGDEAMRSAASKEAINFYLNALMKLKNRYEPRTEQTQILEIEEKLAYAYYADGQNVKATEHFNIALSPYNLTIQQKGPLLTLLGMVRDMLVLRFRIKFWNGIIKRENSVDDNRLMKMLLFRNEAIATYSPKEAVIHGLYCLSRVPMHVLTGSDYGVGALVELSTVFPWSGRSIAFGRMLNTFASKITDRSNLHIWLIYMYVGVMFEYFTDRLTPESHDEKAFKFGMETGQVWAPTIYHSFKCISLVEQGLREKSQNVLKNMHVLATTLENSLSLMQYYRAQQTYLLKYRKLDEVIENTERFIEECVKTDHKTMQFLQYCLASMAVCLKNDLQQARVHFQKAEILQKTLWLNYYVSITLLTKAFIELSELSSDNNYVKSESLAGFSKTTQALLKATKKVHCTKTEGYRFRALYFQLSGNHKLALKYYKKSIDFAQWYGARIELSRTYFELGKFLSDPKTEKTKLNRLTGTDYLSKAKTLFVEMDLQWDLERYEEFMKLKNRPAE